MMGRRGTQLYIGRNPWIMPRFIGQSAQLLNVTWVRNEIVCHNVLAVLPAFHCDSSKRLVL